MDDSPATTKPRRWKRWAGVSVVVLAAILGISLLRSESANMQLARSVQLGQSLADVEAIFGKRIAVKYRGADGGIGLLVGDLELLQLHVNGAIRRWTGLRLLSRERDDWPIHIHFDTDDRVDRIKRGSEIIER